MPECNSFRKPPAPGHSRALGTGLLLLAAACGESAQTPPPPVPPPPPAPPTLTLGLQSVATGLSTPLLVTAPAGDGRLFIVEKTGKIRIVKNGTLLPQPFLDLSALVTSGSEQGLLGLAFHPRYASNGLLVVDYTDAGGDTRVATYHVSADADRADPASAQAILSIAQPYANHNGGHVAFGPDGMLYIGTGDGGDGGDPQGHGQNRNDLLGSLLRIEVLDNGSSRIPPDNPFASTAGARPELWNYGLRNPWRFSFDRATGDLYIADVGQSAWEEIDVATAASGGGKGLDYGWNVMEGNHCYGAASCTQTGLTLPLVEYSHGSGCSITGGFVYRGATIPALRGTYFYADYCEGWVRSFTLAGGAATGQTTWPSLAPGGTITSFGEDAAGELYLCSGSTIYRIVQGS